MEHIGVEKPQEKVIKEFECTDCNQLVTQKELIIPMRTRKGEKVIANYGCKCADIELAKKSINLQKDLRARKMQHFFDQNSLVNKSLQKATLENYDPTSDELAKAKQQITNYNNEID